MSWTRRNVQQQRPNIPYSVCAVTAVAMSDARNVAMSPTSLVDSCCFSGARRAASSCNPCPAQRGGTVRLAHTMPWSRRVR